MSWANGFQTGIKSAYKASGNAETFPYYAGLGIRGTISLAANGLKARIDAGSPPAGSLQVLGDLRKLQLVLGMNSDEEPLSSAAVYRNLAEKFDGATLSSPMPGNIIRVDSITAAALGVPLEWKQPASSLAFQAGSLLYQVSELASVSGIADFAGTWGTVTEYAADAAGAAGDAVAPIVSPMGEALGDALSAVSGGLKKALWVVGGIAAAWLLLSNKRKGIDQ